MKKKLNKKLLNLIALCSGLTATVSLGIGGVIYSLRQSDPIYQDFLPDEVYEINSDNVLIGFKDQFLNDPTSKIYKDNFKDCHTMRIPARVTSINANAFCTYNQSTYQYVTTIPDFINNLTFAEGSKCSSIGNRAFINCSSLISIILSNSLFTIEYSAFADCSSLTTIDFSKATNLSSIGDSAFYSCSQLTSVDLSNCTVLSSMGSSIFYSCSSLTSIKLPSSIDEIPDAAFGNCSALSSIDLSHYDKLSLINGCAFEYCSALTSVSFPESLEKIENGVFSGCSSLASINFPSNLSSIGNAAFYNCPALNSISLPTNLVELGYDVFSKCLNLSIITWDSWKGNTILPTEYLPFASVCPDGGTVTVTNPSDDAHDSIALLEYLLNNGGLPESWRPAPELPDSVYRIENNVLMGFTSEFLANPNVYRLCDTMQIPARVTSINANAFCANYKSTIPSFIKKLTFSEGSGCSSINDSAFYNCRSLISVDLSNTTNLSLIGGYAFTSCKAMTSIKFPDSLTKIQTYAFYGCSSLPSISFPSGLKTIEGSSAFYDCSGLTAIDFSKCTNLSSLGSYTFVQCINLKSLNLSNCNNLTKVGNNNFVYCNSLASINFPATLTEIGNANFDGCKNLTSINLSNLTNLQRISNYAFSRCTKLGSITFPNNLSWIDNSAFSSCTSLTSIDFSRATNLSRISYYAFQNCSSLTTIDLSKCTNLSLINQSAFQNCSALTSIDLPASLNSIGEGVFAGCSSLNNITWDSWKGNTTLDDTVFAGVCPDGGTVTVTNPSGQDSIDLLNYLLKNGGLPETWKLEDRALPEEVFKIDGDMIRGFKNEFLNDPTSPIYKDNYKNCNTIEIPAGIRSAPGFAGSDVPKFITKLTFAEGSIFNTTNSFTFAGWKSLISADFSNATSCVGFGTYFFKNDSSLTSIILPPGLNTISGNAFDSCTSLTTIDLSNCDNLSSIGNYAFQNCSALISVSFPTNLNEIGKYAFTNCPKLNSITWDAWKGNITFPYSNAFSGVCPDGGTVTVSNPSDDAHNSQALLDYLKANAGLPEGWHI